MRQEKREKMRIKEGAIYILFFIITRSEDNESSLIEKNDSFTLDN